MIVLAGVITLLGMISIYKVAYWNQLYFKFEDICSCPLPFAKRPLLYWLFPVGLCVLAIAIAKSYFILILLLFLLSMEIGVIKAKRHYIMKMAKYIMENEQISFKEARQKAKSCIKGLDYMKNHLNKS